jgi:hypothetical protein
VGDHASSILSVSDKVTSFLARVPLALAKEDDEEGYLDTLIIGLSIVGH